MNLLHQLLTRRKNYYKDLVGIYIKKAIEWPLWKRESQKLSEHPHAGFMLYGLFGKSKITLNEARDIMSII